MGRHKFSLIYNSIILFVLIPLQGSSQIEGKAMLDRQMFNSGKPNENIKTSVVIWYMGDQSIQEVPAIDIHTDSTGSQIRTYIKYYLFIDANLRYYLYFGSFSDTAKLLMHYRDASAVERYGGWNLYSDKEFKYDGTKKLTDTIIGISTYSRFNFSKIDNDGKESKFILYSTCEKKDVPVLYLKPFSKKIGCPVLRMDTYYQGRLVATTKFQYISDKLTDQEKIVFKTWQKYLKRLR